MSHNYYLCYNTAAINPSTFVTTGNLRFVDTSNTTTTNHIHTYILHTTTTTTHTPAVPTPQRDTP